MYPHLTIQAIPSAKRDEARRHKTMLGFFDANECHAEVKRDFQHAGFRIEQILISDKVKLSFPIVPIIPMSCRKGVVTSRPERRDSQPIGEIRTGANRRK